SGEKPSCPDAKPSSSSVVFLALAVVGLTDRDAQTVRGAYLVMEPAARLILVPLPQSLGHVLHKLLRRRVALGFSLAFARHDPHGVQPGSELLGGKASAEFTMQRRTRFEIAQVFQVSACALRTVRCGVWAAASAASGSGVREATLDEHQIEVWSVTD